MKMNKLKRSHDRKVTNLVNNAGNGSLIQNTFGLPAGKNYSCPSATSICADFKKDCVKRNAEMLFRIHWDGDFFNEDYTQAWRSVIEEQPDIQFWVYTRVMSAALTLKDIPNLSLYYSTDSDNVDNAKILSNDHGIKLAYLADTFAMGKEQLLSLVNKTGVPCPENNKKIPLIDKGGSACVKCSQCVVGRNNILFSATKK